METGVRTRAVSFSLREDSHWARRVLDASRVRSIRSWRHPGPRPRSSLASAWPPHPGTEAPARRPRSRSGGLVRVEPRYGSCSGSRSRVLRRCIGTSGMPRVGNPSARCTRPRPGSPSHPGTVSIWSLFHGPRLREAFTRAARRARYAVLQVFEALDLLDEFRFHRIDSPAPSREKGNAVRRAEERLASDPRPTEPVANCP